MGTASEYAQCIEKLEKTLDSAFQKLQQLRQEQQSGEAARPLSPATKYSLTLGDVLEILVDSQVPADSLDTVVYAATMAVRAEAGSLLLIDKENQQLVFEAVYGRKSEEIKKFTVKLGHGIAGFVAATGQVLAVTDVQKCEQWDSSISEAIQFDTRSSLAVPVLSRSGVVGVLEIINKGEEQGFSQKDIEVVSRFAAVAMGCLERRAITSLTASLLNRIQSFGAVPLNQLHETLKAGLEELRASEDHARAVNLAVTVAGICSRGVVEAELCQTVLHALMSYFTQKDRLENLYLHREGLV